VKGLKESVAIVTGGGGGIGGAICHRLGGAGVKLAVFDIDIDIDVSGGLTMCG